MAENSKTGLIIAIVGGIAIVGIALYLRSKNRSQQIGNNQMDMQQGRIYEDPINTGIRPNTQPSQDKIPDIVSQEIQTRPSYSILTAIESRKLREYIASILDSSQAEKLQGWISTIRQQRAQDSTRWKIGEGYTSLNASDVSHGLYQMSQQGSFNWTSAVRDNVISNQ
jgi:hypothetical protein